MAGGIAAVPGRATFQTWYSFNSAPGYSLATLFEKTKGNNQNSSPDKGSRLGTFAKIA